MPNEGRIDQDAIHQESTTDNRGASYNHVGTVHNAPVIQNTVHQSDSTVHHVERQDPWAIETFSKFLLGWLGEGRTVVYGWIMALLGVGAILSPSWVAALESASTPLLYAGLAVAMVGGLFIAAHRFKRNSTCPECNEEFALREQDGATAREVETSEGPVREITRPYKCSNCSYQTNRSYTVEVEATD